MKRCGRCDSIKPESEFNKNSSTKDGLQKQCRECQRTTNRKHFQSNPGPYRERTRESNKVRRLWVIELLNSLKDVPCVDCGARYPPHVMDFDHLRDKEFNISTDSRRTSKTREEILAEVDKCEVVCSNCHRERTYQRRSIGV